MIEFQKNNTGMVELQKNNASLSFSETVLKGDKGDPGITPHIGENGNWYIGDTDTGKPSRGEKGDKGNKGAPGAKGTDGKTPVKGTDYWTAADKTEIVNDTLAALPTWNGGGY